MRGNRSQSQLSRRLGLRSNPVYRWESGRAWPTAQQLFQIARVCGTAVEQPLCLFLGGQLPREGLETRSGICEVLQLLCANFRIQEMACKLLRSRFVVSRWLSGKCDIRLPDLLRLVDASSLRLLDFLALFVDPSELAAVGTRWKRLQVARAAANVSPWSHAVLRVLELSAYKCELCPKPGWIAARLGISLEEEQRCIELLRSGGQIRRVRGHYRPRSVQVVDTGVDVQQKRKLRAFWSNVAVERLLSGAPGRHAFNLFAIAEKDLEKVQSMHSEFFERMRALIDDSAPAERVVLYCAQILALDTP